jgi:hypothetical protein
VKFPTGLLVASFVVILSALPLRLLAQTSPVSLACSQWVETSTVAATGNETVIAKDILLVSDDGGKTGLSIYTFLNSTRKVIVVSIQALGAGTCVDRGDRLLIIFENGSSLNLVNMNDFNCDGSSTLYFGGGIGRKDELSVLTKLKIQTMTVWTRDSFMKMNFSPQKATAFLETLRCLSDALL